MSCDVPMLTWEEYEADAPCPGCGMPYVDGERWEFKGTMHFTDEERARHEAEEARFKARHPECHSHRHSVSGSLTLHCGKCCPPPPMSPSQREEIARLFSHRTPPEQLMRRRLRLVCGHVVERTANSSHKSIHNAFTGSTTCTECGLDPATIVDAEAIGLAAETLTAAVAGRPTSVTPKVRKPTKAELEAKVRELEAEVARLQVSD